MKHALGAYGQDMTALAAKDYFFEGNRWKVAYFEYLTNVTPLDRKAGFGPAFGGGGRGESGSRDPHLPRRHTAALGHACGFNPLIGKIALDAGVDILPLHIEGAYQAMPKGSAAEQRDIHVRIGPPLQIGHLRALTADISQRMRRGGGSPDPFGGRAPQRGKYSTWPNFERKTPLTSSSHRRSPRRRSQGGPRFSVWALRRRAGRAPCVLVFLFG